jgi:murein DD-endopeptidase MepM/ murein hydrolase activator NlpD
MFGVAFVSRPAPEEDADLGLVTAARADSGVTVSEATPEPLLFPPGPEARLGDRGSLSERSSAQAPEPTPLPTPVAVDPHATPLPGPVTSGIAGHPLDATRGGAPAQRTLIFPVPGGAISQTYRAGHEGVDISASPGTVVVAAEAGLITWAGWRNNGGGLVVEIDHGTGLTTTYNHLGSVSVAAGQRVTRGGAIGGMGCTGICYGPHVQFDVRVNGGLVDPLSLL